MSFDNPTELQTDGLSTFTVLQIDSLSGILDVVSSTRIGRRTVVDKRLEVDDVIRSD
jgi:hypothetical protein